jgi:EAL domain-containing protein (putative c-di-GMP-specific phosphodiesterase class I)
LAALVGRQRRRSSLHVAVDTLKIDKTFIDSLEDGPKEAALARAVIEFGAIVGLETVAEGIETVGALKQLVDLHCRYGQGHLLSRPLDEAAIDEFIARGSRARSRPTRSMTAPAGDVV